MSGPFGSSQWMYKSGEDYQIDQSLRFDNTRVTYLHRNTVATDAGRKKFTISCWFKLGNSGGIAGSGSCAFFRAEDAQITYESGGKISVLGGSATSRTGAQFRDPSAWYHVVFAVDTTQGTAANRVKIYINGAHSPSENTSFPSQNANVLGASGLQYIGSNFTPGGAIMDGHLAEYHFLDTIAATPSDFGETGDYGEWKPIEYAGNHGTNGFYLPFKADYTVEGFSTVVWKGSGGTLPNYIGGTGFQPDMVWIKNRDSAIGHFLYDSVRGHGKNLQPEGTGAEAATVQQSAFNSDGFTVANISGGTATNKAGEKTVAWCWDMDDGTRRKIFITPFGTAKHVDDESKVPASSTSIYTPSGNANYVKIGEPGDIDFGSSNMTIEFWVKNGAGYNFSGYGGSHSIYVAPGGGDDGQVYINTSGGNAAIDIAPTWTDWNHIAIVRVGDVFTVYLNGTATGGTATLTGTLASHAYHLGRNGTDSADGVGYFDEIRFSDSARYTSNFTPSVAGFADDANTLCLIHSFQRDDSTSIIDGGDVNTTGGLNAVVQANPTYGQSIVSYFGSGSAATVGHGLSAAPEWILVKNRQNTDAWSVYYGDNTDYMVLNTTAATADNANRWNDTSPTSSVFTVGTDHSVNADGEPYIAYCWHSVANYTKIGTYTGDATTDGSLSVAVGFKPAFVIIKRTDGTNGWLMIDNTRNSSNPVNHYHYANTNDTEADGSICNFTSTGFDLLTNLADVNADGGTYTYMAHIDKREYAYWLDQSGNNNDWTSNGLTESDIMVDSPTNSFATLNPLARDGDVSVREGNLKALQAGVQHDAISGTMAPTTGKWYFEACLAQAEANVFIGLITTNNRITGNTYDAVGSWYLNTGASTYNNGTESNASLTAVPTGGIVQVAYDLDNSKIWFGVNNTWILSGDPASAANPVYTNLSGTVIAAGSFYQAEIGATFNFGADSSFAGLKTSQGKQDGNDIGDFAYTPPAGFLSLCTKNLPEPDVIPGEHFNTVLYTGDGSAQDITTVGFQPDWVWIKNRSAADSHQVFDSVRGVTNAMHIDTTAQEAANDDTLTHFLSNGFTTGDDDVTNTNSESYVAWNWKAGTAFSNDASSTSVGSIDSAGSVNTDAGFSVIGYTGTGTTGTVAHGLAGVPEMYIVKNRDAADNWATYFEVLGNDKRVALDSTAIIQDTNNWDSTSPTSTVFTVKGGENRVNDSNEKYISYHFRSIDGYSRVGNYTGGGNVDTFVYTGFRPAFVLIKNTNEAGEGFVIMNNKSDPSNVVGTYLTAYGNTAEQGTALTTSTRSIDILSNGFKIIGNSTEINEDDTEHVFLALAETPFKYSNGR